MISGIHVPAGANAILSYGAEVTAYAPLDQEAAIVNTATYTQNEDGTWTVIPGTAVLSVKGTV